MATQISTEADRDYPAGTVVGHGTDGEGSADVGLALQLPDGSQLWCGEITRARWAEAGPEAASLGADDGWWIILYARDETIVIGKCVDQFRASDLMNVLAHAISAGIAAA